MVKNLPANAGDMGSIPGSESPLGGGNGNPFHYSYQRSLVGYSPWGHKRVRHNTTRLNTTQQQHKRG